MRLALFVPLLALLAVANAGQENLRSLLSDSYKEQDEEYYYPTYYCDPKDYKDTCPEYYECEETYHGEPYCEEREKCHGYGKDDCEYEEECWYGQCVYKPIYCDPKDYKDECPEYYECEEIHGDPYCEKREKCHENGYGKEECEYEEDCYYHQCVYKPIYCKPADYGYKSDKDDYKSDKDDYKSDKDDYEHECPEYYDCREIKGDPYCKHEQRCYKNDYGKEECEYDKKCWEYQCIPYYCDPYAKYDECEKGYGYGWKCEPIDPVCYYDHAICYSGKCEKHSR